MPQQYFPNIKKKKKIIKLSNDAKNKKERQTSTYYFDDFSIINDVIKYKKSQ